MNFFSKLDYTIYIRDNNGWPKIAFNFQDITGQLLKG